MRKILIAGFSGAGKSSLLGQLKSKPQTNAPQRLDDLDELILQGNKEYKSIKMLVENLGWEKFRLIERQTFEEWLKEEESGVLALGGGTLNPLLWNLYGNSHRIKFVHIWASFETCWSRIISSSEIRPLVQLGKNQLEQLYHERMKILNLISCKIVNENKEDLMNLSKRFLEKIS